MILINCDMGEGIGDEPKIMPFLNSCSIACGGHTGDEKSMYETIALAKEYNIDIGGHPSFPDRNNFGRRYMKIEEDKLTQIVFKQILELANIAESQNHQLTHIKAHGALYHAAANNEKEATVLLNVMDKLEGNLSLYAPPGSLLQKRAEERKINVVTETFGDRAYQDDYNLVERSAPFGVLINPEQIVNQIIAIFTTQSVISISGKKLLINSDTICVHSDNEATLQALKMLREMNY